MVLASGGGIGFTRKRRRDEKNKKKTSPCGIDGGVPVHRFGRRAWVWGWRRPDVYELLGHRYGKSRGHAKVGHRERDGAVSGSGGTRSFKCRESPVENTSSPRQRPVRRAVERMGRLRFRSGGEKRKLRCARPSRSRGLSGRTASGAKRQRGCLQLLP